MFNLIRWFLFSNSSVYMALKKDGSVYVKFDNGTYWRLVLNKISVTASKVDVQHIANSEKKGSIREAFVFSQKAVLKENTVILENGAVYDIISIMDAEQFNDFIKNQPSKLDLDIHKLLTHNLTETVISEKNLFNTLVSKTIPKYHWIFPTTEKGKVIIDMAFNDGFGLAPIKIRVYENFGEIKAFNNDTEMIPTKYQYEMFIKTYVESIISRVGPITDPKLLKIFDLVKNG